MRSKALLSAVLVLASCKLPLKSHHDSGVAAPTVTTPPPPDPLTPKWTDYDLKFTELPATAIAYFTLTGTVYELRFTGFPAGTNVTIKGKKSAIGASTYSERVDVGDAIADLSPTDAMGYAFKFDPKIDFTIESPGYGPTPLSAPSRNVSYVVKDMMSKAINHPVLFAHEAPTDPPLAVHSILYTGMAPESYGPATKLREVDWVAVVEKSSGPKKTKVCTVKPTPTPTGGLGRAPSTVPPISSVTLDLQDQTVSVVDRKTTKVVSTKTFAAKTDCPMYAYAATQISLPDELEIKRWVRDERTAHP